MQRILKIKKRMVRYGGAAMLILLWYLPWLEQSVQVHTEQKEFLTAYVKETDSEKEQNPPKRTKNNKKTENGTKETGRIAEVEKQEDRTIAWEELWKCNADIAAWIYLPETEIDYPVVIGKDEKYYLTHNVKKEERIYGSIFGMPDTKRDFSEKHIVLYGHNMRNGNMFGNLKQFRKESFRKEHPYCYVYLPNRKIRFRIFQVEEISCDSEVYQTKFASETEWQDWKAYVLHEKDISSVMEKILTLSTCVGDGSRKERLVVHAFAE